MEIYGTDIIGKAYDVRDGAYARSTYAGGKTNLFDFSNAEGGQTETVDGQEYEIPGQIDSLVILQSGSAETVATDESSEVTRTLELSVSGSYSKGIYGGEASAKYRGSFTNSESYYHIESRAKIQRYMMELKRNAEDPTGAPGYKYLTAEAKKNIDGTMAADELIERYGTHYVAGGIFGGEWNYTQSVSKYHYASSTDAKAAVSGYSSTWRAKGSVSYSEASSGSSERSEATLYQVGGDESTLSENPTFQPWAESVTFDNVVLVDFPDQSLIPISELATSAERKKEIELAIEEHMDGISIPEGKRLKWDTSKDQWYTDSDNGSKAVSSSDMDYKMRFYTTNTSKVLVGFGATVADNNFRYLVAEWLDLDSGERTYDYETYDGYTPRSGPTNFERYVYLKDRNMLDSVITGMGMAVNDNKVKNLRIYHSQIDPTNEADPLRGTQGSFDEGNGNVERKNFLGHDYVVVGVAVKAEKDKIKKLYLKYAPLQLVDA